MNLMYYFSLTIRLPRYRWERTKWSNTNRVLWVNMIGRKFTIFSSFRKSSILCFTVSMRDFQEFSRVFSLILLLKTDDDDTRARISHIEMFRNILFPISSLSLIHLAAPPQSDCAKENSGKLVVNLNKFYCVLRSYRKEELWSFLDDLWEKSLYFLK